MIFSFVARFIPLRPSANDRARTPVAAEYLLGRAFQSQHRPEVGG